MLIGLAQLVVTTFLIAGLWRIFTKAGRPGWAALIPVYNMVVMLQITGRSGWWILGLLVPLLNVFVGIRLYFELARAFGRGLGFGFGLLLLSPIFAPILGFGNSTYTGPAARRPASA